MSFTNQTKKNTYSGDGVTAAFAFSFPILAETDLLVQIKDTNGTVTSKTITTHYTVSGTGNRTGLTDYTSGTVTFTAGNIPAATDTVIIKRNIQGTQETDYTEKGAFPAETHERALDKLTMLHLQQTEDIDRSLKVDSAVSGFDGTLPTPVAGKFIKVDSAGTGLELSDDTSVLGDLSKDDGTFYVGDGTTVVAESGNTARTSLGLGTGDNVTFTDVTATGNITVTGTVDGRDIATDGTKLDGIESGATADQSAAEIKTAYESNADTNAFTDADHTKLDGIEAAADVTDETNVKAALDGATITSATVAAGDKVLIQDVDDSDNLKYVTTQSIADLGGGTVQIVRSEDTTATSTTAVIPSDNTIPQNTEGTEYLTVSITPTASDSELKVEFTVFVQATSTIAASAALFRDSTADADYAILTGTSTNERGILTGSYVYTSGSTSSTTFKLRIGPWAAGTVYINRTPGGTVFGSASIGYLQVTEYLQ